MELRSFKFALIKLFVAIIVCLFIWCCCFYLICNVGKCVRVCLKKKFGFLRWNIIQKQANKQEKKTQQIMYRYDKYLAKNLLSFNESEIFRHTFHLNIVCVCVCRVVVNSKKSIFHLSFFSVVHLSFKATGQSNLDIFFSDDDCCLIIKH